MKLIFVLKSQLVGYLYKRLKEQSWAILEFVFVIIKLNYYPIKNNVWHPWTLHAR